MTLFNVVDKEYLNKEKNQYIYSEKKMHLSQLYKTVSKVAGIVVAGLVSFLDFLRA
jgi:uncharacterized phage protein gp47/JayE